jgi:hypothetical protein
MSDTEEPEYDTTIISCCQCEKKAEVPTILVWNEWISCSQVPPGWYVTDTYPPGDDGLRFACSISCVQKYVEEHTH